MRSSRPLAYEGRGWLCVVRGGYLSRSFPWPGLASRSASVPACVPWNSSKKSCTASRLVSDVRKWNSGFLVLSWRYSAIMSPKMCAFEGGVYTIEFAPAWMVSCMDSSVDVSHDLGRLGAGGDVEDGDAGIEARLHVLVAGGDGRDDGDVDDAADEADVGVAHGGVHDHGERALGLCVLRDDDGAHAARGAAADAHEDGADRGADDGLRDGLLRRERVDGEHGVRVAVADDGDVRGEDDGLDAAPHDDHALGLVDHVWDLNGVRSQRAGDAWDVVFVLGCGDHAFTFPSGVGALPPVRWRSRRRDYGR